MNKKLPQLIDGSIKLELNVAKIYMFFCDTFPEDSDFWRKLVSEEEEHAYLIKIAKGTFLSPHQFPSEFLVSSVQMLCETNNMLISLLKEYNEKPPSRESAFNIALGIEKSAGEHHYQRAMEKSTTSSTMETLQILNKGCKNHANRISAYMSDKGIKIRDDKQGQQA